MSSTHHGGTEPNAPTPAPGAAPLRYVQRYPGAPPELVPVDAPYPASAPPPRGRGGSLIGLIVGILALLLLCGGAYALQSFLQALRGPVASEEDLAAARDTVEDYLTAVADGDAEKALTFVRATGADDLLTDEMLETSTARGGIGEFAVQDAVDLHFGEIQVDVRFGSGGEAVMHSYRVYRAGGWAITDGLVDVTSVAAFGDVEATINGIVAPDVVYLFPGTYDIGIDSEYLIVAGRGQTRLLGGWTGNPVATELTLTDAGEQRFRELVTASIQECIASTAVDTECGFAAEGLVVGDGITVGQQPVEGSVHRALTPESLDELTRLTGEWVGGGTVTSYATIDATADFLAEKDGQTAQITGAQTGPMRVPSIDFSVEEPVVTWG